jgi:hypothetical protein
MAKEKRNAAAGNDQWRSFMLVIESARGVEYGRLPRGGAQVSPFPLEPLTQLPAEWDADTAHASHVIYHYGTAVAWIDGRDGGWVVPDVDYSPQTSGVQNRIRKHIGAGKYRTTVKG